MSSCLTSQRLKTTFELTETLHVKNQLFKDVKHTVVFMFLVVVYPLIDALKYYRLAFTLSNSNLFDSWRHVVNTIERKFSGVVSIGHQWQQCACSYYSETTMHMTPDDILQQCFSVVDSCQT